MLPKLNNLIYSSEFDRVNIVCRNDSGEERAFIGALRHSETVTITAEVLRSLGTSAVVLRVYPDVADNNECANTDKEYFDFAFDFDFFDGLKDTYTLTFSPAVLSDEPSGLYYYEFIFLRGFNTLFSSTENNVDFELVERSSGRFRLLVYQDGFSDTIPDWLGNRVMYHIFVDRFFKGEGECVCSEGSEHNDDWKYGVPQYGERPGAPVKNNVFFGGNLWGVIEKLPYLSSLGIGIIYLSPVFSASSNHKYDTSDYLHIDPGFGGDGAFDALTEAAHKVGIKIILDGVFNHTGDDSIYFDRYHRAFGAWTNPSSAFRNWYYFKDDSAKAEFEYEEKGTDLIPPYECWWGVPTLPKLKLENKECQSFFIGNNGVCKKYILQGADGWRLDVADELPDDFLIGLRQAVKEASPDAAVIGEVWENAADKISYGNRRSYFRGRQLDSVMNYPLRSALLGYAEYCDADFLADELKEIYSSYPRAVSDSLMNIVGTHDTERILTLLGDPEGASIAADLPNRDRAKLRLSAEARAKAVKKLKVISSLQYSVYGFPCVYYGDERGMEGQGDPFCRFPMLWDERTDNELLHHYQELSRVRRYAAFDHGDFEILGTEGGYIEFVRAKNDGTKTYRVRVAANIGENSVKMRVKGAWYELYSETAGTGDIEVKFGDFVFITEKE